MPRLWRVAIDTIASGLSLGAVTIKDGVGVAVAKVAAAAGLLEADSLVGVHDPVAGLAADAVPADLGAATGSHSSKLRAMVQLAFAGLKAGAKGGTAATPVTSTAEGADHQGLDVQLYHSGAAVNPTAIRALTNADVASVEQSDPSKLKGQVTIVADTSPAVANTPIGGAGGIAVADDVTHAIDGGVDLAAGATYKVEIWADTLTDIAAGWIKSAAAVGAQGDGDPLTFNVSPLSRIVRPVAGKTRLSFMRNASYPVALHVYVTRLDA